MIRLTVDTSAITAHLGAFQDQVPFATALALNRTADAVQSAIRSGITERFTIRRPWVLQGVKIERRDRATKLIPQVTIGIDAQRGFLSKFEAGGEKRPAQGGRSLALPSAGVRPVISVIVPKAKRPRAFHFVRRETQSGSSFEIFEGAQHTFMIRTPDGHGYVFQRLSTHGRRRRGAPRRLLGLHGGDPNVQLLYVLEPEAKIAPTLEFVSTAERIVTEQFTSIFNDAWQQAVATAR